MLIKYLNNLLTLITIFKLCLLAQLNKLKSLLITLYTKLPLYDKAIIFCA